VGDFGVGVFVDCLVVYFGELFDVGVLNVGIIDMIVLVYRMSDE